MPDRPMLRMAKEKRKSRSEGFRGGGLVAYRAPEG
jgi:hypothetical protein